MQYTWTYTDPLNTIYNIGLYHGLDTGHVMVYCNDSIVIIDFSILEQKKYSFYVGEEFFELYLNKNEDASFSYELKINNTVNTPLNKQRNAEQKNYNTLALVLGIAFIVIIGITIYFSVR